ncbi:Utp14-domain-containing protein [Sarocladium strictum]
MPGRQAHGRSLTTGPPKSKSKAGKSSKARSQKNALNAFGIAQDNFATKQKLTPRARQLDAEFEGRDGGGADDDDEDDDLDEDDEPRRKKPKSSRGPAGGDVEYGSDSEGNEWQLGGLAEDDEDSEIDSDEAFGDSDNEKFQGYSLKNNKTAKRDMDDSEDETEDDSNDDEGETLGAEAIDLATALDQYESESAAGEQEGSEDEDSGSEGSDESEENSEDDDEDGSEVDPDQLAALQGMVSGFGNSKDNEDENVDKSSRQKISLGDLGLSSLDDPHMRKSLKLLKKEDKEKRPGATKKLDVPLTRREQGRLDRKVAYDKTNETLARWDDTVKENRQADHLVFPLPENAANYGLAMNEIRPLAPTEAANELESTIMGIMEQSGLSLEKEKKERPAEYDEEGNLLTHREAQNLKRKQREENAREAKRQKRIKKIKSKAYHRVHRRERERNEADAAEGEEVDSEAEREAQDRRRALERVGQRHKESKWAKQGARAKRAVWDDEFRTGLSEMARRDEELRRRKEGRSGEVDDDSDTSSEGSSGEDSDGALRREIDALEQDSDGEGRSRLDNLKFMRNAAARKRAEELELLKGIRRTLDDEDGAELEEKEITEVGRRQYGNASGKTPFAPALGTSSRKAPEDTMPMDEDDVEIKTNTKATPEGTRASWSAPAKPAKKEPSNAENKDSWTLGAPRRKRKHDESASKSAILDISSSNIRQPDTIMLSNSDDSASDADSEDAPQTSNKAQKSKNTKVSRSELLARAFAGDTAIEEDFAREKAETTREEDDKIVDNTLPGWGSWVGDGVSQKDRARNKGRYVVKQEGIKAKDRKDAKLDRVIMNEKHAKKNSKYLATQLPHMYESKQQYERSLRLPVGPEWVTKQTHHEATQPRVRVKQGIITPLSRPRTS